MYNSKIWRYNIVAIIVHWVMAALLAGLVILGWYMMSIAESKGSGWYFNLHKSFGIVAGVFIFFRLFWRIKHKVPELSSSIPYWQRLASRLTHLLLYLGMLIMPISGFIGSSYGSHGISFFGIKLPIWVKQNADISDLCFATHKVVVWILVGLVVLHILAALKHLLINKDNVFQRMWPL